MKTVRKDRLTATRGLSNLLLFSLIACGAPKGTMESKTFVPKEQRPQRIVAGDESISNAKSTTGTGTTPVKVDEPNDAQSPTNDTEQPIETAEKPTEILPDNPIEDPADDTLPSGGGDVKETTSTTDDQKADEIIIVPKQIKPAILTSLTLDPVDAQAILSLRTSISSWSIAKDAPLDAKAFDISTGALIPGAINPCATLPNLAVNYSPVVLPSGELNCWSIDATRVIVVTHIKDQQSGNTTAYGVTNLQWASFGKQMSDDDFSAYKILGLSEGHLFLSSKDEFLSLTLKNGTLSLTALDLGALKLESAPDSGFLETQSGRRLVKLSIGTDLYIAEETTPNSSNFLWSEFTTKIEADASLNLTAEQLNEGEKQYRFLLRQSQGAESASLSFLIHGSKLYRSTLGDAASNPVDTPAQWAGTAFLNKYCASCHSSAAGAQAGLRMLIDGQPNLAVLKEKSAMIIQRINLQRPNALAMPPYEPLPTSAEIKAFEDALGEL